MILESNKTEREAINLLTLAEDLVSNERMVSAIQTVVNMWRKHEEAAAKRITSYRTSLGLFEAQVQALVVRRDELREEVRALQATLAELVTTVNRHHAVEALGLGNGTAEYMKHAKLLLEPGRKITDGTLEALGLSSLLRQRPSEQFVRTVAAFVLPVLGFETIISRTAHPDLICRKNGKLLGVEVEVSLSDYDSHKHDASQAHIVACWKPPTQKDHLEKTDCGTFFEAANCIRGYSPRLSIIAIQSVSLFGDPEGVGAKNEDYIARCAEAGA